MSKKPTKINPRPQHEAHSHKQIGKRSLLLKFIIFITWVAVISLLIPLVACQQSEPINFVIKVGS
ncbi:MAG: hypothetical protein N2B60_08925 [Psychrobacter sp.]